MTSTTSLSPTNPGRNAADPSHSYSVPESLPSYHDSQIASSVRPTTALSTIHESALTNSSGHQWLFLRTNTRPRKPESLPFLWEGDIITGNVVLDLREKTAESAKGVTISVGTYIHAPLCSQARSRCLCTQFDVGRSSVARHLSEETKISSSKKHRSSGRRLPRERWESCKASRPGPFDFPCRNK